MSQPTIRRFLPGHRWEGVPLLAYKEDGGTFQSVSRQVLFEGLPGLPVQLRYFEVGPGGHTTLERHEHAHLVWISRGRGQVYLGGVIKGLFPGDVVTIPPQVWHQFRALKAEPLGFHCLVALDRDKPTRPSDEQWQTLVQDATAASFLRR